MTAESTACPLCEFVDDPSGVYHHLQISHRKSALAKALVETPASPRVGAELRVDPGEYD